MKHERATEEIRELAALYALGSLTQHEAHSFEIHMREGCSICETEFRKFEHIVAGVGLAVDEVPVPDYLRDLLLARIEREGQPIKLPAPQTGLHDSKPKPRRLDSPRPPQLLFSQQPQKKPVAAWALTAIFALLSLFMYVAWKSNQAATKKLQVKYSAADTDLKELGTLLKIQRGRLEQLEQILSVTNKPGSRILRMVGQASAPDAAGALLWDDSDGKFIALGVLPLLPTGKAYQLWFISPTARVPAGQFKQNPTGRFFIAEPIPQEAANATVAAITMEPDNGSLLPTPPFYAIARITN